MTGGRHPIFLVAAREIRERVRSRAFALSTLAIVVIVVVGVIASGSEDKTPRLHAGATGPTPAALVSALRDSARANGATLELKRYPTTKAGERAVRDGKAGVLIVDGRRLVWKSDPNVRLAAVVSSALQRLEWGRRAAALGLTPAQAAGLSQPVRVSAKRLEPANADREHEQDAAAIASVLLLIMVLWYGAAVAEGVGQEKGGRVMEVLLSRVRSRDLLAGKVLGIGLVGLAQLGAAVAAGFAAISALNDIDVPKAISETLGSTLLWFTLGYALFSMAYAALGALVSRVEDVQAATAPLTWVLMAGYAVGLVASDLPNAWYMVAASLFPITAPFVMPVRAAVSSVPVWQVALAVVIMLAAVYGLVRLAAAVYSGALLRTGARPHLRDLWNAARAA